MRFQSSMPTLSNPTFPPTCHIETPSGSAGRSIGNRLSAYIRQAWHKAGTLAATLVGAVRKARRASHEARIAAHRCQESVDLLAYQLGMLGDL